MRPRRAGTALVSGVSGALWAFWRVAGRCLPSRPVRDEVPIVGTCDGRTVPTSISLTPHVSVSPGAGQGCNRYILLARHNCPYFAGFSRAEAF